jgi:hypothetical protein
MGKQIVAILVLLAAAAGGAALYMMRGEEKSSSNASALGQPLFPQLKAAEVARIVVQEPKATLTLEKKDGRWVIMERDGFPADVDRVGELVVKVIELKTGQTEPISEKERARMQLAAPAKADAAAKGGAAAAKGDVSAGKGEGAATKGEGTATTLSFKAQDGKTLA